MPEDKGLFDRLKDRGDEIFTQISGELMQNQHFMNAMEGAVRGKQRLDEAAGKALRSMNIPTRSEFKRALSRIDALEGEVADLRAKLKKAKTAARPAAARKGSKR